MQKNLYNLKNPQKEISEHDTKKILTWIIVLVLVIGGGYLVYKKFINKEPTFEEKMDVLNSLQTEDSEISKEQNIEVLNSIKSNTSEDTYSNEQKLDILNNL